MARMYSRKRGKAGSKRPLKKTLPSWVRYKAKEVEMLVTKLAKEGKTSTQIGIVLRDTYGIPNAKLVLGKSITRLLEEKKLRSKVPEDLMSLIKRSITLRKHLERNHKDQSARRGLTLTESKIKRISKYYRKTGKIPSNWKYSPDKIKLYVE